MGFIRFLLALSVLIFHSTSLYGFTLLPGLVAVKGFFMISGFYMSFILDTKYIGNSFYKKFILNRFLRIYPEYWLILILSIVINYVWVFSGVAKTFAPVFPIRHFFLYDSLLGILRDITLLIRGDYINLQKLKLPLVAPAWTLIPELLFYFIVPFLWKRKWWFLCLLTLLSISLRIFMEVHYHFLSETQVTIFFPASMCYFLFGIFSYRWYGTLLTKNIQKYMFFVVFSLLCLSIIFWHKIPDISLFSFSLNEYFFYILLFFSIPPVFVLSQKNSIDTFLAKLSYPMYISHWFLFSFITYTFSFRERNNTFVTICIIITIVFSQLMIIFIGNPIDRWRKQIMKGNV